MPDFIQSNRSRIYLESTQSLCSVCKRVIPAKIVIESGSVWLDKYCPEHGEHREIFEEDADYHKNKRRFDKPGTTMMVHTPVNRGCPLDCGICPQHEQHACIGLIEVTRACDMACPTCYADAGNLDASRSGMSSMPGMPGNASSCGDVHVESGPHLSLERIGAMMDFFISSEGGQAEILQISGGEPTCHPDIIEIIRMAKNKNIRYVMLNTNGLRIAEDEGFTAALKQFEGGFEVYLQFDGFKDSTYGTLRGRPDLLAVKERALEMLAKYEVPTTLVTTVKTGVNDDELGRIFLYGLKHPFVRGINLQPEAWFGRRPVLAGEKRVTLSGVINRLSEQTSGMLRKDDFIPLPCNVERVAITYLYRDEKGSFIPITRHANIEEHLPYINNTFVFTVEDALKNAGGTLDSLEGICGCFKFLKDFKEMVPFDFFLKNKRQKKAYIDENTFRISISSFVDAYNFDLKGMQKECVHVVTPDLRKIPFSSYNTLHRALERGTTEECEEEVGAC